MKYLLILMLAIGLILVGCSTDEDGPTEVVPEADITDLVINEFMASNDSAYADENGEFDDWIEVYNHSDFELDLGGVYITDTIGDTTMTTWQIPAGSDDTKIAPKGFLILWADKETDQGPLHVNIKLSGSGEDIALTAADGITSIDELTYTEQTEDISYGRIPDGSPNWGTLDPPTPGMPNNPPMPSGTIVINEFMSHNDTAYPGDDEDYPDWIELYNTGNTPINVGGWYMSDNMEELTASMIPADVPDITTIPGHGYLLLLADSQAFPGPLHMGFKLGDDEEFALTAADGTTIIDQQNTVVVPDDQSKGRVPDGSDNWEIITDPTPGEAN